MHVQQPRCGACGQARLLVGVLPGSGSRICNTCEGRRRHEANPCAVCGRHEFRTRDREGRPRCRAHPPDDGVDPMDGLCQVIQQICPTLPEQTVAEAVRAVEPVTARQRKLLWALEDRPGLLTGQGAQGPVKALHLIAALREREAVNLVVPGCPYCGRNVPLPRTRNGLRCCAECRSAARAEPCVLFLVLVADVAAGLLVVIVLAVRGLGRMDTNSGQTAASAPSVDWAPVLGYGALALTVGVTALVLLWIGHRAIGAVQMTFCAFLAVHTLASWP
ncbi:hypothetical protein SGRIM128S_02306 [Streptomyces griseomycini]